jgi:pimeloyl-ACP methyl ester carboxylesterase
MTTRFRWVFRIGAMLLFIVLIGATYQGVSTAFERRRFPRPGHLVRVGNHQLHINCVGDGAPVVVLEAPAAGMSAAWGWVQPGVARVTRTCAYDRAGLGWSERAEGPFVPADAAGELYRALDGDHDQPPFVVVGQGLGAAFARLFASQYGDKMAALILIDDPVRASAPTERGGLLRTPALWPWFARIGVLKGTRALSQRADGLPQPAGGALVAFLNRPDHLAQATRELAREQELLALADTARLPAVPVTHLEALGQQRVAFLADRAIADRVTAAIVAMVQHVRTGATVTQDAGRER